MKKQYITPNTRAIKLGTEQIIATSSISKSAQSLDSENDILSNHRNASESIWGDED